MSFDLPKTYDPKETDAKWYHFWEEGNFFRADVSSSKPPYSIVIPPPNVTGILHMGHAIVNTLQDILIRWKRMSGYEPLWVPGTDHAGIATQTVVERHLMKTEGKRRDDYSREEFLKIVWKWKENHEERIINQLKSLGCSCDWSRLRFTMDEGCSRAVRTTFKKLFDAGLIYQGDYLVNWDPITQTALADDEVEYEERETFLWYLKYPLVDGSGFVHIATTRPETMLGDSAVAVSPKDKRYAHLIGKMVRLPIIEREIPIIADRHVDPEFGTGMVKVTPAHDPNDYRMGLDHNLPMINVMTPDGAINENGGPFKGMDREKAREEVVKHMKGLDLVEKIERYTHRVGVSYRSKAIIEPLLSKQWFVKMEPFIEPMKKAVQEKKVTILPKSWEHTYFHWADNLRDWCISRQLWWGHRIPVWHHKENPEKVICYDGDGAPPEVQAEPEMWEQDPDVLDTWFSSSLWPLSALGWPEKTEELKRFYPTSVLITGHDIIFFWVARMIFMDEYLSGEEPFPETFLTGLIYGKSYWKKNKEGGITYITGKEKKEYDLGKPIPKGIHSKWEKLSKSKGNAIDPLEMIDDYGTDAVRMSLCACANQSPQIDLDRRRFEEFKNFTNKIWNGSRFVFMNLEGLESDELSKGFDEKLLALEDRWILSKLNRVNKDVNEALQNYSFDISAMASYDFFWKAFCAYYVEIAKPVLFGKTGSLEEKRNKQILLVIVLTNALRLLHPMAPFIT
ncbi:MAG: Valine--tRNA ligase [Chlamydiae bacterium]|nr:Valine--tRNA ligase [Chlamydiota bacterium]